MQFFVRTTEYQNNSMLNICDMELLGKKISNEKIDININKNYYGERIVETNEAKELLQTSSIINMVGSETISLSISMGIGTQKGVREIDGIPFLIVFKM